MNYRLLVFMKTTLMLLFARACRAWPPTFQYLCLSPTADRYSPDNLSRQVGKVEVSPAARATLGTVRKRTQACGPPGQQG